jgi:hypothetical protein
MIAPPSTAMPLRTQRNAKLSATESVPLPIPRSVALARPRTGLPPLTPRAAMLSPQITGSIPPSLPLGPPATRNRPKPTANAASTSSSTPQTTAPLPTRNRSKPIANAASTSSPIKPDQTKQPKTPQLNSPAPSTHSVRAPEGPPEVLPPKP